MTEDWSFSDAKNTATFVCAHVVDQGSPILSVVHDSEGDWQFLCGGEHGEADWKQAKVVGLEEIVRMDASVAELSSMCLGHSATREALGQPWRFHDDAEDTIRDHVERYGWHVCVIPADESGPAFAYSIGLQRTFGQPEIICFGLGIETLHAIVNTVGESMREGVRFEDGTVSSDILEGYDCQLRTVRSNYYREYFGYGMWFYGGPNFPALQLIWPDRNGLFPWQEGVSTGAQAQPLLFEPK